jgi:hypothetical protein
VLGKETLVRVTMRRLISLAILLGAVGFAIWPAAAGDKKCLTISGTGDGINKRVAVESSRSAIKTEIEKIETENHVTSVEAKAWKPDPRPYWRSGVSADLFLTPDGLHHLLEGRRLACRLHLGHGSLLADELEHDPESCRLFG